MSDCSGATDEIENGFRPPRRWHLVERRRLRRAADAQLLFGAAPDSLPLLVWRAWQLTSGRNRRVLAKSLRGIVDELDEHLLPGASPLNRAAARPHVDLIGALADRLEEVARPVSARGILLVEALLTDGSGPLYARHRAGELREAIEHCLAELEGTTRGQGRVRVSTIGSRAHTRPHARSASVTRTVGR